jgi:membrane peptidoglycan carboxypeptidase
MLGYEPTITTAAKSGTSDWDSIVVGFNPQYTLAIWNGYDDNQPMTLEAERKLSKLIFRDTFNELYKDSSSDPWYQLTDKLHARKVNPITGELSSFGSWYWYYKNDAIHNTQIIEESHNSLE